MLGRSIADPDGIEGQPGSSAGLGLLDVETVLTPVKQLRVEQATHAASGAAISGYHMHMGVTEGADRRRAFAHVSGAPEGAISADGRVSGTYLHGLFAADPFRRAFLGNAASPDLAYEAGIEQTLDDLAAHLEKHLDIDALLALAEQVT
jgi:adenosylcobyric acid synthase